jgi:Domain of unknown function (DUF4872)/Butirosin biosynthesis protein H, N-terminal
MTEQKNLKRLVRARMVGTGESYTTARRHVLAKAGRDRAAALPPGLVADYPQFGGGQHHQSTLLAHLLRQAGHRMPGGEPFGEAMLAGLAGGIGFMYAVFEYQGMPPLMTIVAQHHPAPWLPTALDHLGIGYAQEHSSAPRPALAALDKALADDRPVYAEVDRTRLPWHGCEPAVYAEPYGVVVAGRHDGTLLLDDTAVVPQPMPVDEFAPAWSAHKKGRHHRLTVAGPASIDLAGATRAAVALTVAHLTGPVLGNSFDVNFGFSGMRKLASQLRDGRGKSGWAARFGEPVAFFHGLRRLYECLEEQYTAPGATRPLYADFLDEAAGTSGGRPAWREAAALFRESGALWSRLAARALAVTEGLGEYAELAEERLALMMREGRAAADRIRALTVRIDELAAAHAAADPLGPDRRRELFDELAELVDTARATEERAVELLPG